MSDQAISYGLKYDSAANITQFASADGTDNIGDDAVDEVTSASPSSTTSTGSLASESYSFDANGDRIGGGYSVGPDNRMLSDGTYNYTYNADGDRASRTMISPPSGSTDAVTLYFYDYDNRLTEVLDENSSYAVTQVVTYTYDYLGRMIREGVGASLSSQSYTYTVYDGENPYLQVGNTTTGSLATSASTATISQRDLYGLAVDQILATDNGSGGVLWGLADYEGTIRDVVNNSGAEVTSGHIQFDSSGAPTNSTAPLTAFLFGLNGMRYDSNTSDYLTETVPYDPSTGQRLSPDPLGFASGTTNFYAWAGNNAVQNQDPSGECDSGYTLGDAIQGGAGYATQLAEAEFNALPPISVGSESLSSIPQMVLSDSGQGSLGSQIVAAGSDQQNDGVGLAAVPAVKPTPTGTTLTPLALMGPNLNSRALTVDISRAFCERQNDLTASNGYVNGCLYWDQLQNAAEFASYDQQQAADRNAQSQHFSQINNEVASAENQAQSEYLATPWGSFSAGFEAGALTLGQAFTSLIPFVDNDGSDARLNTAWRQSGIQGTWTEVATRVDAKVTAAYTFGLAGYGVLPEGAAAVLASPYVQTPLFGLAATGTVVNGVNAYDAYQNGNMAAFGDSLGNAIVCGAGAIGSGYSLVTDPGVQAMASEIWSTDDGGLYWPWGQPTPNAPNATTNLGAIQEGEVTTFQDSVDRSVVGDNLEGHELWQHAN